MKALEILKQKAKEKFPHMAEEQIMEVINFAFYDLAPAMMMADESAAKAIAGVMVMAAPMAKQFLKAVVDKIDGEQDIK